MNSLRAARWWSLWKLHFWPEAPVEREGLSFDEKSVLCLLLWKVAPTSDLTTVLAEICAILVNEYIFRGTCWTQQQKENVNDPDVIWTRNLLIWSQTRYRCATESLHVQFLLQDSIDINKSIKIQQTCGPNHFCCQKTKWPPMAMLTFDFYHAWTQSIKFTAEAGGGKRTLLTGLYVF